MNHIRACRVCLAYNIRLHSISGCQLQDIYEKFTESSLETGDMKPTCVCYICFSLLKKFQKFIEKSKKSDQLLEQMINSGLELSVNSLELFCKQHTEFPWTLGMAPTVRVLSVTEEEVNMETLFKVDENSEMDVCDQNEDDLDGISLELEVTNQDSLSDFEDSLPLQNLSNSTLYNQWKADRSNESEIKTSEILKPDAREIIISKEEQLQQMPEQSMKLLNYQNSPFKCDLCCKGFVDAEAFENHQKKHAEVLHLPKKRKSVNETEKEILKSHALIPNNEKTTSNINSDKNSKTKATSNEQVTAANNIFICDVCKKEYLCKSLLENHIKIRHKFEIDSKPNSLTDSNTNYQNCKNTKLSIRKDVLKNNSVSENKLSKNKNKPSKDSICSDETQYKCSYCMKCFTKSYNLSTHVRIHTREKPYKCSSCTKCFSQRGHLNRHVSIHKEEKPHKCSYCTKCFTTNGQLANHVRIHKREKPYECSFCMKCFSHNSALATHVRIHTGEKPYKCSSCTKCFSQRGHLDTHLSIHTGEKSHKCSYCTKCFSQRGLLNRHVRIHKGEKPHKCSYCTKCFSERGNLVKHLRIHTGEKPHKCSYCTKCFSQRGQLNRHVKIHTREKPYKCR